jgi:hypothetical protein
MSKTINFPREGVPQVTVDEWLSQNGYPDTRNFVDQYGGKVYSETQLAVANLPQLQSNGKMNLCLTLGYANKYIDSFLQLSNSVLALTDIQSAILQMVEDATSDNVDINDPTSDHPGVIRLLASAIGIELPKAENMTEAWEHEQCIASLNGLPVKIKISWAHPEEQATEDWYVSLSWGTSDAYQRAWLYAASGIPGLGGVWEINRSPHFNYGVFSYVEGEPTLPLITIEDLESSALERVANFNVIDAILSKCSTVNIPNSSDIAMVMDAYPGATITSTLRTSLASMNVYSLPAILNWIFSVIELGSEGVLAAGQNGQDYYVTPVDNPLYVDGLIETACAIVGGSIDVLISQALVIIGTCIRGIWGVIVAVSGTILTMIVNPSSIAGTTPSVTIDANSNWTGLIDWPLTKPVTVADTNANGILELCRERGGLLIPGVLNITGDKYMSPSWMLVGVPSGSTGAPWIQLLPQFGTVGRVDYDNDWVLTDNQGSATSLDITLSLPSSNKFAGVSGVDFTPSPAVGSVEFRDMNRAMLACYATAMNSRIRGSLGGLTSYSMNIDESVFSLHDVVPFAITTTSPYIVTDFRFSGTDRNKLTSLINNIVDNTRKRLGVVRSQSDVAKFLLSCSCIAIARSLNEGGYGNSSGDAQTLSYIRNLQSFVTAISSYLDTPINPYLYASTDNLNPVSPALAYQANIKTPSYSSAVVASIGWIAVATIAAALATKLLVLPRVRSYTMMKYVKAEADFNKEREKLLSGTGSKKDFLRASKRLWRSKGRLATLGVPNIGGLGLSSVPASNKVSLGNKIAQYLYADASVDNQIIYSLISGHAFTPDEN